MVDEKLYSEGLAKAHAAKHPLDDVKFHKVTLIIATRGEHNVPWDWDWDEIVGDPPIDDPEAGTLVIEVDSKIMTRDEVGKETWDNLISALGGLDEKED